MNKIPSWSTQRAALLFLVLGFSTLPASFLYLITSFTSFSDRLNPFTHLVLVMLSALWAFVGWYLIKLERWTYFLGLALVMATTMMVWAYMGSAAIYGYLGCFVMVILLVSGRKDFKVG